MCGSMVDIQSTAAEIRRGKKERKTRMWASAQPDGRPAEPSWRPLFNAANSSHNYQLQSAAHVFYKIELHIYSAHVFVALNQTGPCFGLFHCCQGL